jgi:alpha-tubulin suppressor-like RCC1 family protein
VVCCSLASAIGFGCGAADPASAESEVETGGVTAELNVVPASVLCVRITYTQAAATSKTFTVATGGATTLSLGKIPLGATKFKGEAFNVACSSVTSSTSPDWITPNDVSATVVLGVDTSVPLTLRPNVANNVQVDFEVVPKKIVAGNKVSFALMPDGTTRSWGGSQVTGDGIEHLVPTTIANLAGFTSIAGSQGGFHACGIKAGQVYCWGDNRLGQFGNGTTTSSTTPVNVTTALASYTWVQVAVGQYHTCILNSAGTVYCTGYGAYGQLGNGTTTSSTSFVYSYLGPAAQIVAEDYASCSVRQDGSAGCTGSNEYGQLGNGTTTAQSYPQRVLIPMGVVELSAGDVHACARLADKRAFCWGYNGYGQLGDGTTTAKSTPVLLGDGSGGIEQIATGWQHTCYRKGTDLWCVGQNIYGSIGVVPNGYQDNYSVYPARVASGVTDVAANGHTCTVYGRPDLAGAPASTLQCWGNNEYGQLGDGTKVNRFVPTDVVW